MNYNIKSKELRKKWLDFYISKGHKNVGAVSLIGDGETGVMFNVAGMQPLMPYLLGKEHPLGKRLCNIQGCVRTVDIDTVGDDCHCTFFEMMGNWSLGDYFKKEKTAWTFELLTKVFGLDADKICSTVFGGNDTAPKDDETAKLLEKVGVKKENIFFLKENWWNLEGTTGTPCGPDNEWFYPKHDKKCCDTCDVNCECGRYVEIGNDVYMQFEQLGGGKYKELVSKNVDTGFGFERNLAFLNNVTDVYKTDLFWNVIELLSSRAGFVYGEDQKKTREVRIVADHTRTAVMLIGDERGIVPSNVGAGYILRRLMRRAIRYIFDLGLDINTMCDVAEIYIDDVYKEAYPLLSEKKQYIFDEIKKESQKFEKTLVQGTREFEKLILGLQKFAPSVKEISGDKAFRLFDTFGFPFELTLEMAREKGYNVNEEQFKLAFARHQAVSKSTEKGENKGGLSERSDITTKMHTATHLLLAGLRHVLGDSVFQRGCNITPERIRFDFSFDRAMTNDEIKEVENFVNKAIADKIDVVKKEMSPEEAHASGAMGIFESKYGNVVSTYKIGNVSYEICGGPHVANTSEIGKFEIVKEQSSSSGIRRIRAELK